MCHKFCDKKRYTISEHLNIFYTDTKKSPVTFVYGFMSNICVKYFVFRSPLWKYLEVKRTGFGHKQNLDLGSSKLCIKVSRRSSKAEASKKDRDCSVRIRCPRLLFSGDLTYHAEVLRFVNIIVIGIVIIAWDTFS